MILAAMTLEEWAAAINANPEDATIRLVFADWLEDHDDPEMRKLAPGMRAFAECGRVPERYSTFESDLYWWWKGSGMSFPSSGWGKQKVDPCRIQYSALDISSYFAAFMFAAREWPKFDQEKFYAEFGPKEAEVAS